MKHRMLPRLLALICLPLFSAPAHAQCSETRLYPTTPAPFRFGNLAVEGTTLLVGDTSEGLGVGIVHVFERGPTGWSFAGLLDAASPEPRYGLRVGLSEGRAIVSAYNGNGSVHVFERNGAGWTETAAFHGKAGFGIAAAIDGDTMAVGAFRGNTSAGFAAGVVTVYEHDGTNWNATATLQASDGALDDLFGHGVHVDGERIFVAATGRARCYVYERSGGTWVETAILDTQLAGSFTYVGFNISGSGDRVVLSSRLGPFVYVHDSQGWQLEQHLTDPFPPNSDFGAAVSLEGDKLLVGARVADRPLFNQGAAYRYVHDGSSWILEQELLASDPHQQDWYGSSVLLSDGEAFVSAPSDENGTVYVYDYVCRVGTRYCAANPNSSGDTGLVEARGSTAIAGADLTLAAERLPAFQFGYFLMSLGQGFLPTVGGGQGNLCLGLPFLRFSQDVLNSGPDGVAGLELDFGALPQSTAFQPGDTWNFQFWFRDQNPAATSNMTDAVAVTFQTNGAPSVQFPVTLRTEVEEAIQFEVPVTLSQPAAVDVSVGYTFSGTATEFVDARVESPNPLVIPAGSMHAMLEIVVAEDTQIESDETVILTLSTPTGAVLGTASTYRLTIEDDD